jgi:hypothetical protein
MIQLTLKTVPSPPVLRDMLEQMGAVGTPVRIRKEG